MRVTGCSPSAAPDRPEHGPTPCAGSLEDRGPPDRRATAAFGEQIWKAFAAAASTQTLSILEGADPSAITRYVDLLEKNPAYQKAWIQPALARDAAMEAKQRAWLLKKRK